MLGTIVHSLIALGVLIFVHELGHFLVAKKGGIRVDRFSLGLGPKIFGFQHGETEYCLSWIPFGGYVKVAGMADVGTEEFRGEPWEFPSKPVWLRMAVIAAGPFMNFAFAFIALMVLFTAYGVETFDSTLVETQEGSAAARAGILKGDRVTHIDGRPVENPYRLLTELEARPGGIGLTVERDGAGFELQLGPGNDPYYGLQLMPSTAVGQVVADMPAATTGLKSGDRILSVGGVDVGDWDEMSTQIRRYPGQEIQLSWLRDGQRLESTITPATHESDGQAVGQIGIRPLIVHSTVGFGNAIVMSAERVVTISWLIVDFIGEIFQGERSTEELGGPLRIAQMAGQSAEQGFKHFLGFMAMLSVNLAVINLLPVPVLDGGHLTFLTLEAIMRRPLSLRQRERLQQVGLMLMLGLMVLVTFNDVTQMFVPRLMELFQ
jgi:regulator of sigma E protease